MVTIALNNLNSLLYDMPYRILSVGRSFNHSIESACTVYTVFYKKDPFFHNSLMTQMMIDLHEIFNSCSWRNTNAKYCNKMWQLAKYPLLVVT